MLSVSVLLVAAVFGYANAKFAFPVPSYYTVERSFRSVRSSIKWDPTNLLTDLAGPLAMCDRLSDWGPAGKKTSMQAESVWNATKIDPIFFPARDSYVVYYFIMQASGADARSVHNDIRQAWYNLERAGFQGSPYTELQTDLQITTRFGCSVEPQCPTTAGVPAKTVAVCLLAQAQILPPYFIVGLNETWSAHSHEMYAKVAEQSFPPDMDFPSYVFVEDEQVVRAAVGDDLCDKHVYDPNGYVAAVQNYWRNPVPAFTHTMGSDNIIGWYLAFVQNINATRVSGVIVADRDNTVPPWFNSNVMNKLYGKSMDRGSMLTKNGAVTHLNTGGCVIGVCPNRYIPRSANSPGKSANKGNFFVLACMTFKSDNLGR